MYSIFLIFVFIFRNSATEEINYCAINMDHILCGANGALVLERHLDYYPKTDADRQELLILVNKIRDTTSAGMLERKGTQFPMASNMFEVEWCEECESAAFNALKNCSVTDSYRECCNCMNSGDMDFLTHLTKNKLYDIRNPINITSEFAKMFDDFEKIKQIPFECVDNVTSSCIEPDPFAIFLLNARTVTLGCAYVICPLVSPEKYGWGNMLCISNLDFKLDVINNPLYLSGTPCSKCDIATSSCSEEYSRLCKCNTISECLIRPAELKPVDPDSSCPTRELQARTALPATNETVDLKAVHDLNPFQAPVA